MKETIVALIILITIICFCINLVLGFMYSLQMNGNLSLLAWLDCFGLIGLSLIITIINHFNKK